LNLVDMLGFADIAQLTRIAGTYRCDCNGHSKHELIQAILSAISRRDVFDAQINLLPIEDLRFLHSLLFDSRDAFSLEELLARIQFSRFDSTGAAAGAAQTQAPLPQAIEEAAGKAKRTAKSKKAPKTADKAEKPSSPRDTVARFKHYGWLFNGLSGTNRYLFHVPSDLKERFREAITRRFMTMIEYTDDPRVYRDEQALLAEDVLHLLDYIDKNEIQVTAEGAMYKRNVQQVLELFGVREELPMKGAWRFGYGRRFKEYPDRMAFVYDYCYYKRWVSEADLKLTLTAAGLEKLASRQLDRPEELYRFWLRLYKSAVPNLLPAAHWIDRLAGSRWVTADSLRQAMLPYIRPFYYDDPRAVFDKRIIGMMLHLGMLRLGEDERTGAVVRMTNAGRSAVAGVRDLEHDTLTLH
jgi:hypothetical protein